MNPILRAAANGLNRSRSEGQIRLEKQKAAQKQKRKQEKEKRRVDALEREEKWMALGKNASKKEDGLAPEESAAEKFQKELCWCIQQLEMGLAKMKPNARQVQEAEKVLRILKSPKAPIAKKRQVMRSTFGDYRNKMLQEEKKHAAVMASKTNISTVPSKAVNRATFFRKAIGSEDYQRSTSLPEGYMPSLSPTEEEVPPGGLAGDHNNVGGRVACCSDIGPSEGSSLSKGKEGEIFAGDADIGDIVQESCNLGDKNGEIPDMNDGGGHPSRAATDGNKKSPTKSVGSNSSSEICDPATSSEHSSQTGYSFRFDFEIDGVGEVVEVNDDNRNKEESLGGDRLDKNCTYREGQDNNEKQEEMIGPANNKGGKGESPVIEGLQGREGKKKRRNRKKKKGKEFEIIDSPKEAMVEGPSEDKNKMVELSVGGGEFKFNFDTEKE